MAVCTYRSWNSFEQRFGRDRRSDELYEVQSYLRHQGRKINDRFDANTYITLTHAMHTHDLGRGRGAYKDGRGCAPCGYGRDRAAVGEDGDPNGGNSFGPLQRPPG